MKLVVGLGNPGTKYVGTRHNIGFAIIDKLLRQRNIDLNQSNFDGQYVKDGDVIFAKPMTFMNLSGDFVQKLMHYFKIDPSDLVVIYDDLDIPTGKLKFRLSGGHGGHNGVKDIINKTSNSNFNRLKVGIGRPTIAMPTAAYVLSYFSDEEKGKLQPAMEAAVEAVEEFLKNGINSAMNKYAGDK